MAGAGAWGYVALMDSNVAKAGQQRSKYKVLGSLTKI